MDGAGAGGVSLPPWPGGLGPWGPSDERNLQFMLRAIPAPLRPV